MSPKGSMEIRASSTKSFDDAVRAAVERAGQTLQNVNCVWVSEQKASVSKGRIAEYEVLVRVRADAVISIDSSQNVVEFDRGAEITFGYSRAEVIGRPLTILIPEKYRSNHERHVRSFRESPTVTKMMGERDRVSGLRKDGTDFPAVASIAKQTGGGEPRYSVLLRDISE